MRMFVAAALAATLFTSTAIADTGPLASGKPAGVQQAQLETGGVLLVVGILAVAGAIAAIASTRQGNGSTSATATSP